jgi:hypothetical protein
MPDKILVEIIADHLPYEIDMLRLTYKELARAKKPENLEEEACHNAIIEAFCVHARSLIHFFASKGRETDAKASEFKTEFVTALDVAKKPLQSILDDVLNKQIFHLTKKRTTIDVKKFDVGDHGWTVLALIEPEIEKFMKALALKPEFGSLGCKTSPIAVGLPFSSTTGSLTITDLAPPTAKSDDN